MNNKLIISFFSIISISIAAFSQKTENSITLRPGSEKGKDAIIIDYKKCAKKNYGSDPQFIASSNSIKRDKQTIRALIEFDLSELPKNATITKAYLDLHAWNSDKGFQKHFANIVNSNACILQRITTPWEENKVNWKNQPETTSENQVIIPLTRDMGFSYVGINGIDVTKLLQDIIKNPNAGFGFMMKLETEKPLKRMNFCSSDHENKYSHPKLIISYILD